MVRAKAGRRLVRVGVGVGVRDRVRVKVRAGVGVGVRVRVRATLRCARKLGRSLRWWEGFTGFIDRAAACGGGGSSAEPSTSSLERLCFGCGRAEGW